MLLDCCVYLWLLPNRMHRSLPAEGTEVCSYISCSSLCKLCHVHTGTNRHPRTQNRQDGLSLLRGGSSNDNLKKKRVKFRASKMYLHLLLCTESYISLSAPPCQIFRACAVLGLSCPAGWWHQRWGSHQTDSSRPSVWEAERQVGSLVPTSRFSSDTESPTHQRTARMDPLQLQIEPAQTQHATSPRSHPAVIPPPEIIIYNCYQK